MIKVINIISDTNIAGAGKCLINFCKNYDDKKFDLIVIIPKGSALKAELKKTKVRLIEIDGLKDKSWDFKALFKLIKIFRKEKPSIVHTHASSTARLAAKFAKNCKIVFTRHSVFPVSERIKKGLGRFIYKTSNELLSDKIIAVAEAAKDNLTEGGINPEKIDVILNGVEEIKEISKEDKQKLKDKYKIKDDEKVIGIIARLEEVKGHETFVEAAKILLNEKKIKAKFLILGTGSEEERLKAKVKKLKLDKNIIFTGFVNNVHEFLNILDIQVNCSFGTEATSLALLEGMSIGVPAVVTDYGGNPGVIFNEKNGLLVPIKSAKVTADAIYKILTDETLKEDMKKNCKEIFKEKFTVDVYKNNIENVYETLEREPRMKKINLFDVFIILIALVAVIIGYKFINKTDNNISTASTEKVIYQVRTSETVQEVYDMIEVGTPIYDSQKNFYIGTIKDKTFEKSVRYASNIADGQYVATEIEDYVDIILTIESNAEYSEQNISVGEFEVKVGSNAYLKGKGYALAGYVVSIER